MREECVLSPGSTFNLINNSFGKGERKMKRDKEIGRETRELERDERKITNFESLHLQKVLSKINAIYIKIILKKEIFADNRILIADNDKIYCTIKDNLQILKMKKGRYHLMICAYIYIQT